MVTFKNTCFIISMSVSSERLFNCILRRNWIPQKYINNKNYENTKYLIWQKLKHKHLTSLQIHFDHNKYQQANYLTKLNFPFITMLNYGHKPIWTLCNSMNIWIHNILTYAIRKLKTMQKTQFSCAFVFFYLVHTYICACNLHLISFYANFQ